MLISYLKKIKQRLILIDIVQRRINGEQNDGLCCIGLRVDVFGPKCNVRKLDATNSSSGSWDATRTQSQDKNYTWFGQYCLRPQSTPDILLYHFE
jgi:hypothetical protein